MVEFQDGRVEEGISVKTPNLPKGDTGVEVLKEVARKVSDLSVHMDRTP